MSSQEKFKISKLVMQRQIDPNSVGGEARKRLRHLYDESSKRGLSNEEMEEINRIVSAHTGMAAVVEAPDLDMLGVVDHERFIERLGSIEYDAEEAYQSGWALEAISLRLLLFDFLLRMYVVHKTKHPVDPKLPFGKLLGKAKGQGFRQKLAADIEAFNEKRILGIHHYLLGRGSYQEIGDAYRDADGLFEAIIDEMVEEMGPPQEGE